jgi:hypothetical protein
VVELLVECIHPLVEPGHKSDNHLDHNQLQVVEQVHIHPVALLVAPILQVVELVLRILVYHLGHNQLQVVEQERIRQVVVPAHIHQVEE